MNANYQLRKINTNDISPTYTEILKTPALLWA